LILAILRLGKIHASRGAAGVLRHLIRKIKRRFLTPKSLCEPMLGSCDFSGELPAG